MKALGFQAFNQLQVHPLSKLWFQNVVNLHPYVAGPLFATYGPGRFLVHLEGQALVDAEAMEAESCGKAVQVDIRLTSGY